MNINRVCNYLKITHKCITNKVITSKNIRQISAFTPDINNSIIKSNNGRRSYATHVSVLTEKPMEHDSIIKKLFKKIPFFNLDKARLNAAAYLLYESIADKINYVDFFEEFCLPDTFYSWFVITELHVWMLMVRCMAEADEGRFVRNAIVQALWTDVNLRVKKLGAANPAGTRMQVQELSEQFQAALIAYDEGLQSSDAVLAGAIWRRFYQSKEIDPENLELLVKYIRKHVKVLDDITKEELFSQKPITWSSIHQNQ